MSRRYVIGISVLLVIVLSIIVSCGPATEEVEEVLDDEVLEVINWNFIWTMPLTDTPHLVLFQDFVEEVKERTDGRLVITCNPVGEYPFEPANYLRHLGEGEVEMADTPGIWVSGDAPTMVVSFLPFLVMPGEEDQANEVILPYVRKELEKFNVTLLFTYMWARTMIWGQGDPVKSVDDLEGLRVRTFGREMAVFAEKIGMIPTTISPGEVASALQYGLVSGVVTSGTTVVEDGWGEFLDWGYNLSPVLIQGYITVNNDALEALPSDIKEILLEVSKEYEPKAMVVTPNKESFYREQVGELFGIVVNEPEEGEVETIAAMMVDLWETWGEEKGGLAQEALNKLREKLGR